MHLGPVDADTLAALIFTTHPKVTEHVVFSGALHAGRAAVLELRAALWAENTDNLRQECRERARDLIAAFQRDVAPERDITHRGY